MEIQDLRPEYEVPVKRIGFRNVLKRIVIRSPSGMYSFDARINLYVEISSERKGAHLSRSVDAINVLDYLPQESWSLEGLVDAIHTQLLKLHPYSMSANVTLYTNYWARAQFGEMSSLEPVKVKVSVKGSSKSKVYSLSVAVKGITVCPSAQSTIASMLGYAGLAPSHSQKVTLVGTIVTNVLKVINVDDIAAQLWKSVSAPAFTLLKRPQEAALVIGAHRNPKFAEDAVRDAVRRLRCLVGDKLPPDSLIRAEIYSLESIHPHDVYAMAEGTLKELPEVNCNDSSSGANNV